MMEVNITLKFDKNDLGQKWMNPDNLALLLYTDAKTKKDLLEVVSYNEAGPPSDSTAIIDAFVAGYKLRAESSDLGYDGISRSWATVKAKEYLQSHGEV